MRSGIIILISILLVFAVLFVVFSFGNISSNSVDNSLGKNYNIGFILDYDVGDVYEPDYQYFYKYDNDNYIYVALKHAYRQIPGSSNYYDFGYIIYYELTSYSSLNNYLLFKISQGYPVSVDLYYSFVDPIPLLNNQSFSINNLFYIDTGYSAFNSNGLEFASLKILFLDFGFNSFANSFSLFVDYHSTLLPVIDSSNIFGVFKFVFYDYPTFIFDFIGNFVRFYVGGNFLWSY